MSTIRPCQCYRVAITCRTGVCGGANNTFECAGRGCATGANMITRITSITVLTFVVRNTRYGTLTDIAAIGTCASSILGI